MRTSLAGREHKNGEEKTERNPAAWVRRDLCSQPWLSRGLWCDGHRSHHPRGDLYEQSSREKEKSELVESPWVAVVNRTEQGSVRGARGSRTPALCSSREPPTHLGLPETDANPSPESAAGVRVFCEQDLTLPSSHTQGRLPRGWRLSQLQRNQPRVQGATGNMNQSLNRSMTDHFRQRVLAWELPSKQRPRSPLVPCRAAVSASHFCRVFCIPVAPVHLPDRLPYSKFGSIVKKTTITLNDAPPSSPQGKAAAV